MSRKILTRFLRRNVFEVALLVMIDVAFCLNLWKITNIRVKIDLVIATLIEVLVYDDFWQRKEIPLIILNKLLFDFYSLFLFTICFGWWKWIYNFLRVSLFWSLDIDVNIGIEIFELARCVRFDKNSKKLWSFKNWLQN